MDDAIQVLNLVKKFKKRKEEIYAVDHLTFSIKKGELFGILGPNGAGKTTLIRCIATLLIPDMGNILIFGKDIFRYPLFARKKIGILTSGERTLYWKLSARDNLKFFAALYGMTGKERDKRIDFLIDLLGLKEFENDRVEKYSSGMKQKVSLARSILHNPEILLFDEPTLGLDPQFSRFIRRFIKEDLNKREGKTILLTTHYMDEADELCDRVGFINKGKIADIKSPEKFKSEIPHKEVLEIRCLPYIDENVVTNSLATVKSIEKVIHFSKDGVMILKIITPRASSVLSEIIEGVRKSAKILTIDVKQPTLEDVFIHLTGVTLKEELVE